MTVAVPISAAQARSRRILLAVGGLALTALVAPWAYRQWQEDHLTAGKTKVLALASARPSLDLALCLLKHQPGGLALAFLSENHYSDPARGLVVELRVSRADRSIGVWLPPGATLQPGEAAQIKSCAAP